MAEPRPMEVVIALRRLGYKDKPGVGDHISMFKLLHHASGPVTIRTGVDGKHCGKGDVSRIQRQTGLTAALWKRALAKKLPMDEYDAHLLAKPKKELVIPFWRETVS